MVFFVGIYEKPIVKLINSAGLWKNLCISMDNFSSVFEGDKAQVDKC